MFSRWFVEGEFVLFELMSHIVGYDAWFVGTDPFVFNCVSDFVFAERAREEVKYVTILPQSGTLFICNLIIKDYLWALVSFCQSSCLMF
jgi:hypothetical protein